MIGFCCMSHTVIYKWIWLLSSKVELWDLIHMLQIYQCQLHAFTSPEICRHLILKWKHIWHEMTKNNGHLNRFTPLRLIQWVTPVHHARFILCFFKSSFRNSPSHCQSYITCVNGINIGLMQKEQVLVQPSHRHDTSTEVRVLWSLKCAFNSGMIPFYY